MNTLKNYLADCKIRGLSANTIDLYDSKLSEFERFKPKIEHHTALYEYLFYRYPNPRTRHQAWRTIRTYVRWLSRNGLCADWTIGFKLRCPAAAQNPTVTQEEFDLIIGAIKNTFDQRRDRALLICLYYTGARRDAIRKLKWADVNLELRTASIKTKGGKEQTIYLPKRAALALNAWRCHCPQTEHIFPSLNNKSRPVDGRQISRRIHVYARRAGITRRIYLHLLRDTFATNLANAGIATETIQAALGHSSISTTAKYISRLRAAQRVRAAVESVFD